ncbi:hypothetical protein K439DRAFT_1392276 [Ramaria rubella]|nr:hypothetical protein K439DRAFT_1392276 [Ramaria rubella]
MNPPPPQRQGLSRRPSANTRYMNMLLSLDAVPRMHNLASSFFTWILLAGFVVLPATFTSIDDVQEDGRPQIEINLLRVVKNLPLFVVAGVCCAIGASGMLWLWKRWSDNYVWLINRIFMPGALNSLTGVVSTLVNVYGAQNGLFSVTARVTIAVTSASCLICGMLTVYYASFKLDRVKKQHRRELSRGFQREGMDGTMLEKAVEKLKTKGKEPEPEPGTFL